MRRFRPVRALAVLALLAALWLAARASRIEQDVAAFAAAPHFTRAERSIAGSQFEAAARHLAAGLHLFPDSARGARLADLLARIEAAPDADLPRLRLAAVEPEGSRDRGSPGSVQPRPMTQVAAAPVPRSPIAQAPPPPLALASQEVGPSAEPATPLLVPAALRSTDASGFAAAEAAFAHLAAGRRRDGSRALRQALALEPDHAGAPLWRRQLSLLEQRWHGAAYIVLRDDGDLLAAASPVLGAGQSGLQLDYLPDPLAPRPLALTGRLTTPNRGAFGEAREWQAALGLSWRPAPSALLTAERLIGLGSRATDAWTLRAAAGAASAPAGDRWLDLSIYGEAGIIGVNRRATFAATQGRAGVGLRLAPGLAGHASLGGWASLQEDASTVGRLDLGPTLGLRVETRPAILLAVDYRIRVAGDARPASGPALTLSTQF